MWKRADEKQRTIRRWRVVFRCALAISLFLSSLFVFLHMLGWYGPSRGMGTPLPLARAAVEFVIYFSFLFLAFLVMGWLKVVRGRSHMSVVICPGCKSVSTRDDPAQCNCGLEREDMADWIWIPDKTDDSGTETGNLANPSFVERTQIWLVRFLAG